MIPDFIDIGAIWKVLPPGVHDATLDEIRERFCSNERRKNLFMGLVRACNDLQKAGCQNIYVDGSFVSNKTLPGDFDACWDPVNVDAGKLDPVLLDFSDGRLRQKQKYGGELFPSNIDADGNFSFMDYFQKDKETGKKKGVIRIHLQQQEGEAKE